MEVTVLQIKVRRNEFFEIDTGSGVIRVTVMDLHGGSAQVGIEAPGCMSIYRDRVLAKLQELRQPRGPEEIGHEEEEVNHAHA